MKFIKKIIKNLVGTFSLLTLVCISLIRFKFNKPDKTVAFLFNISNWKKEYVLPYVIEYNVVFVPKSKAYWMLKPLLRMVQNKVFIVWGFNNNNPIKDLALKFDIQIYRMEDGFLRSKGLGVTHTPPFSLCIDKKGIYFDSTQPSELEEILNNYDFKKNPELIKRAENCIRMLLKNQVSKYNHVHQQNIHAIYGPKSKKRILVIGQVEDDASILYGSNKKWTNNDLVRLAKEENPDAEIIYKPHPDVLIGKRAMLSNPKEVESIAKVIMQPLSIPDALETIDHIYTITSLAGFEAILRDIPVTTVGAPFYSGWGLTDDRQKVPRRKRNLTKYELFAGAYILYPQYINPYTKKEIEIEEVIKYISHNSNN